MEVIKEEPNSDEEIHPISSQNEHCLVYTKDNHSVHATFFVVGTETEVRFSYCYLLDLLTFYTVALLAVVQYWHIALN